MSIEIRELRGVGIKPYYGIRNPMEYSAYIIESLKIQITSIKKQTNIN